MIPMEVKQTRIARIIDEIVKQRGENQPVDYLAVARRYPELMPDLAIRFAALEAQEDGEPRRDDPEGDPGLNMIGESFPEMDHVECLDRGAQGCVYKAFHRPTKREVAIKMLQAGPAATLEQRRRFKREVELVARLRHPHIVRIYDTGEVSGYSYIVMEYIQGFRIDDHVCLEQLSVRDTVTLFCSVCDAVSVAHQNGVLHRDLKPSNILVDAERQPHVLDFGLAKDMGPSQEASLVSLTGQVVGTLPYLSPDQVRGEHGNVQTDIYALGVILYELLTGEYPYPISEDRFQSLSNIVHHEPMSPRKLLSSQSSGIIRCSDINRDLERIILKALAKDPVSRYSSTAEFSDDLRRYLSGEAVLARSASRIYVLRKTVRRFRALFIASTVCVLVLIAALISATAAWRRSDKVAKVAMAGLEMASILKVGSVERDAGRLDHAIGLFENVIEIGETVRTSDVVVLSQLIGAHHQLSSLLFDKQEKGRAAIHAQKAFDLAGKLMALGPSNLEYLRQVVSAWIARGRQDYENGEYESALARFRQAFEIQEHITTKNPGEASLAYDLASILGWQGSCARKLERMDKAANYYTRAYKIARSLAAAAPANLERRLEALRTESRMAIYHLSYRIPEHNLQARKWLNRAQAHLSEIKSDPMAPQRRWTIEQLDFEIDANLDLANRRIAAETEVY